MGLLTIVNHFGTFLLLVATVLLIVGSITAPTVNSISFLTVDLGGSAGEITFGTFGYCVRGGANDRCSGTSIGYDPARIVSQVDGADYSRYRADTAEALTNVMILHPISAGLTFIAFVLSLGSGFFGSLSASLLALTSFVVTLVALVCDWVWMSLIRNNINSDKDGGRVGSRARYDAALWCVLAAAVCALLASVILFVTCCAGRRKRSREQHQRRKMDYTNSPPATYHTRTQTRRRWWSRNRY